MPSVQLEGYPQFRRAKSGEYRMIYQLENGVITVTVLKIRQRNDGEVYKNLDQL